MNRQVSFAWMAIVALAAACKTGSPAQQSPLAVNPGEQVAVVDGQPVTYGDVQKEHGSKLIQAEVKALTELQDARRSAVDEYVTKRLIDAEAKSKGETLEQWYEKEVLGGIAAPGDDEVKKFYEQNKSQMGGQSYDQMQPRIANYLKQQRGREQLGKAVEELKAKHGVQITLAQPNLPRIEVAATGPSRGPDQAPVTIVEFSDFQCPYCGREFPVVERLMKEYDGKVRLVFRHFPLDFHPYAQKAAEAGACAADQGIDKFWKMHDKMFGNQQKLAVDDLKSYAKEVGVDSTRFDKCLDSGEKRALVNADEKAGQQAGVSGTPAFFVNGIFINGAVPYEQFKETVDRELNRKG
ncbi:MAG TPA: thioredoxin domain-containing protein [Myxococcales bacterium]|nr:thioredoxin domain-containing protein [Myxococcales bacterium]